MIATTNLHIDELVIRPVERGDVGAITKLGRLAGPGMTIPMDEDVAMKKIKESMASFNGEFDDGTNSEDAEISEVRKFWMVVENRLLDKVVGIAGIYSDAGHFPAFVHDKDKNRITLRHHLSGNTEIGTLFVHPDHRRYITGDAGKTLSVGRAASLSRFMLMAAKPDWFGQSVFAEIRGYQPTPGENIFYDKLWKGALKKTFTEADRRVVQIGHKHLSKFPEVYDGKHDLSSWTEEELRSIGRPHDVSAKAGKILEVEGFVPIDGSCDLIGGGPHVICGVKGIASVRNTKPLRDFGAELFKSQEIFAVANGVPSDFRIAFMNGFSPEGMQHCEEMTETEAGVVRQLFLELPAHDHEPA